MNHPLQPLVEKMPEQRDAGERCSVAAGSASDPICGNCGNPLSKHLHEREEYCNDTTTGDIFTDDPRAELLANWLEVQNPTFYALLVADWKRAHGHQPNT